MRGSFLTARDIFNHSIWKNIIDFRLFFLIYGNATFLEEYKHGTIELKRGQWLRSFRNLQKDLEYEDNKKMKQYALATIKSSIKRLANDEMITAETLKQGTLFTVLNYDKYQKLETYKQGNPELYPEHQNGRTPNTLERAQTPVVTRFFDREIGNPEHQNEGTPNFTPNKNKNVLKNNGLLEVEEVKNAPNIYDEFYLSYGKQPTPIQIQKINSYMDDGMDITCISYAIEKASTASGHFNYLLSILNNWYKKGIKTVEEVKQTEQKRIKGGTTTNGTSGSVEDKYRGKNFGF